MDWVGYEECEVKVIKAVIEDRRLDRLTGVIKIRVVSDVV